MPLFLGKEMRLRREDRRYADAGSEREVRVQMGCWGDVEMRGGGFVYAFDFWGHGIRAREGRK